MSPGRCPVTCFRGQAGLRSWLGFSRHQPPEGPAASVSVQRARSLGLEHSPDSGPAPFVRRLTGWGGLSAEPWLPGSPRAHGRACPGGALRGRVPDPRWAGFASARLFRPIPHFSGLSQCALPGLPSSPALSALRPSRWGPRSVWLSNFGYFSRALPVHGAGAGPWAGAGLEARSPARSERDPRARRTWGRAAPATQPRRRECGPLAFGALASALAEGRGPWPRSLGPRTLALRGSPTRPRPRARDPSQGSASRIPWPGLLNAAGNAVYYSLESWQGGRLAPLSTAKVHSQSALDVGPALTPRPALRPGTPTWRKFLDGSEASASPAPALQVLALRSSGGPGTGAGGASGKFTPGARGTALPPPAGG